MDKLIEEYVNRMSLEDINNFARKNGISLNEEELNLIYNHIKNDWRTIVHGNPRGILDNLKSKLSEESYNKIEQFYIQFKNRYL